MENQRKIPASVFILTKNSAATIGRALASVKEFDDIVVCDGGSADGTVEIAKNLRARVFEQPPECLDEKGRIFDFSCARNACAANARHKWVCYLDSDEAISPGLVSEIRKVAESGGAPEYLAYRIPIGYERHDGRIVKYSSNYPGYQVRMWHKDSGAFFRKAVHEKITFPRPGVTAGTFENPWINYLPASGFFRDYWSSNKKFLELAVASSRGVPRLERLRRAKNALRSAAGVFIRSCRNYLHRGFHDSMPIGMEAGRFWYQLSLAIRLLMITFK